MYKILASFRMFGRAVLFQDVFPDVNDGTLSPSGGFFCSSKILENDKCGVMSKDLEDYRIHEKDSLAMTAAHVSQTDALPALKRARKATQRYIGEVAITLSRPPTRKRNFSSLAGMDKSLGVNNHKTCHVKSRVIRLPAEESSVRAIQVPFASLVQKESQKKHAFHAERAVHVAVSPQKRDVCFRAAHYKKMDYCYYTKESPEEVIHWRKHHRLWKISEVRKLIDGISQYGVGRWSRIKKLFFPTSVHRTSVDIKDKWRNLLKASGSQEQNKRQGEKRRNIAWRPLPKPIRQRVCELAIMYPYPKGRKPEIAHFHRISSDGSTDTTLRDCIRIVRRVNGN